jgi:hypothetical protein
MGNRHAKNVNPTNEVPPPNEKPEKIFYLNKYTQFLSCKNIPNISKIYLICI